MPLNLLTLPASEAERIAYSEGFTMAAELFARIAELEAERDTLEEELDEARADSLTQWEKENGDAEQYKEFFFDCFGRLAGHYPCPSVSSEYDKSVIFAAIERSEELDANGGSNG